MVKKEWRLVLDWKMERRWVPEKVRVRIRLMEGPRRGRIPVAEHVARNGPLLANEYMAEVMDLCGL